LHGGGWILGSLDTHDRIMRLLAEKSGVAVLGVDYRLAPEHKFPAGHDDALAALRHLLRDGAGLGIDPARLAVGGDSAGANMALASCLQLAPAERAAVEQHLLYFRPSGLSALPSPRRGRPLGKAPAVSPRAVPVFSPACLARPPADAADIRYDCLSADLRGLPPALIVASALDPLLDDSRALAELLAAA